VPDEPPSCFPSFAQALETLFVRAFQGWLKRLDPSADDPSSDEACWVDVGGLADLRANRLVVDMNGTSVLVVRTGRSLAAVENECPHLGQRLSDGQVSGRVIRCAAHGYRWDLVTGRPVQGLRVQRRRPLREVPVRLDRDRIMLAWTEG
jgi:3-phenylpropionate/trans-cinnamate dioxygenase ferredoxin subunit